MGRLSDSVVAAAAVVAAACAVVMVGLRIGDALKQDAMAPHTVPDAGSYATSGHVLGPPDGAVRIVEFADYQCPYCRKEAEVLDDLLRAHAGEVSVVYRHYPLSIHDSARAAAQAAECASLFGAFQRMHRALFSYADSIGHRPWRWFAGIAGIQDLNGFDHCVNDDAVMPQIGRDRAAGERLGVTATPTLLVGSTEIIGAASFAEMDKYVRAALRGAGGVN